MPSYGQYNVRSSAAIALRETFLGGGFRCNGSHATVSFRGEGGTVGTRDRATHLLHWYPAKMFYRIPYHILDALEPSRDAIVLDPFCGSGTVVLEAMLRGHQAIGIDVNPLARLISTAKTTCLNRSHVAHSLDKIINQAKRYRSVPSEDQLPQFWFTDGPRRALHRLHRAIDATTTAKYRNFFLVTLASIVRRCSLADPTIAPPVKLSEERSDIAGVRYRNNLSAAKAVDFSHTMTKFIRAAQRNNARVHSLAGSNSSGVKVLAATAATTTLADQSIDLVITSPPYCGAQKYVRSFQLELRLLGYSSADVAELDRRTLGTERAVRIHPHDVCLPAGTETLLGQVAARNSRRAAMLRDYLGGLVHFAAELRRVLKPHGNAFVSFGTSRVAGIAVNLADIFVEIATAARFCHIATLEDEIPSRGLITKRHSSAATIGEESVLWLKAT